MILSPTQTSIVKQYLPGVYFIGLATWIGYQNTTYWMGLVVALFIMQMLLNNRYINLMLGFLTILCSIYMVVALFYQVDTAISFVPITLILIILNFYMSRMLFLNQNFSMSSLRENSLDEILFL
jgi:hypothetical protein